MNFFYPFRARVTALISSFISPEGFLPISSRRKSGRMKSPGCTVSAFHKTQIIPFSINDNLFQRNKIEAAVYSVPLPMLRRNATLRSPSSTCIYRRPNASSGAIDLVRGNLSPRRYTNDRKSRNVTVYVVRRASNVYLNLSFRGRAPSERSPLDSPSVRLSAITFPR